jgi:BirA family biotin operon repressor/biotin-[acetyl-CoA-carboxylase] ligase
MQLRDFNEQLTAKVELHTRNRILFSSIDSTNGVGKRIASFYQRNGEALPSTVLVAIEQTSGRGRFGSLWLSPPGGIYISIVQPIGELEILSTLPMRVATTLCRELDEILDSPCRLKWPNDLMVNGKKLGGILIETVGSGEKLAAVIGFGINHSTDLPQLASTSTTVSKEAEDVPSLAATAGRLIRVLETELAQSASAAAVVREYSRWSLHDVGQDIRCRTTVGRHAGQFMGFDERGFLRVLTTTGERLIPAGEIIEGEDVRHHES